MELFCRQTGSGEPLVILHGLYGSSDNWYSIGRELASSFSVYMIDQRNHGNSPHNPAHNYPVMTDDLYEFILKHRIGKSIIIGHSMGGKTALEFGIRHPELVEAMIVVDISPLAYSIESDTTRSMDHLQVIRLLKSLDTGRLKTREDADILLQQQIPSLRVRQFLLKNLKRALDGKFFWALNIDALEHNMTAIYDGVIHPGATNPAIIPEFPLLFIKGALSDYIGPDDAAAIRNFFPWAELAVITGAGHWVHAEQPAAFLQALKNFLASSQTTGH
jgi:esterase